MRLTLSMPTCLQQIILSICNICHSGEPMCWRPPQKVSTCHLAQRCLVRPSPALSVMRGSWLQHRREIIGSSFLGDHVILCIE